MRHRFYHHKFSAVNDNAFERSFARLADIDCIDWVAAYVITDEEYIAVMHMPATCNQEEDTDFINLSAAVIADRIFSIV